jgi:hypothetical protein
MDRLFSQFSAIVGKTYVDQITHNTLFLYMAKLKDGGSSPKTILDRAQAIETFRVRGCSLPAL